MVNMADYSTKTGGRLLLLIGLITSGCAIGPEFRLTSQEQTAAEDWALSVQLMNLSDDPKAIGPATPRSDWDTAVCRWTWTLNVASCETRSRPSSGGPWVSASRRFKQQGDGAWELLPP